MFSLTLQAVTDSLVAEADGCREAAGGDGPVSSDDLLPLLIATLIQVRPLRRRRLKLQQRWLWNLWTLMRPDMLDISSCDRADLGGGGDRELASPAMMHQTIRSVCLAGADLAPVQLPAVPFKVEIFETYSAVSLTATVTAGADAAPVQLPAVPG